jgi:hypothetical protein
MESNVLSAPSVKITSNCIDYATGYFFLNSSNVINRPAAKSSCPRFIPSKTCAGNVSSSFSNDISNASKNAYNFLLVNRWVY